MVCQPYNLANPIESKKKCTSNSSVQFKVVGVNLHRVAYEEGRTIRLLFIFQNGSSVELFVTSFCGVLYSLLPTTPILSLILRDHYLIQATVAQRRHALTIKGRVYNCLQCLRMYRHQQVNMDLPTAV